MWASLSLLKIVVDAILGQTLCQWEKGKKFKYSFALINSITISVNASVETMM